LAVVVVITFRVAQLSIVSRRLQKNSKLLAFFNFNFKKNHQLVDCNFSEVTRSFGKVMAKEFANLMQDGCMLPWWAIVISPELTKV